MIEEWLIISDFPAYAVSSLGRVKRILPDARNHKVTGLPLKAAKSPSGYLFVSLCIFGGTANVRINRIVCKAFHGSPPSILHHAAHNDGNASNNHKDNLRWATGTENEADKMIHGTKNLGERHGCSKLTAKDVKKIRSDGRSQRVIASEFGVSQFAIWDIKSGNAWRHV